MATAEGDRLTEQYRRASLAVRAAGLQDMTRAWGLWTPGRVAEFGRFTDLAVPLLESRYAQAAALGAGYYRRFRAAAGVDGGDTPRMPGRLSADEVLRSLRATALPGTMRAIRAGFSPQAASRAGLVQALGSAGRLILNGGRDAILASVGADPAAVGWQRIASGGACEFCRMLASRGPAYKSDRTASFLAHDHCACSAQPMFERAPVPAGALPGGGGRRAVPGQGGPGQGGASGNGGGPPPAPPAGGEPPERDDPAPVLPETNLDLTAAERARLDLPGDVSRHPPKADTPRPPPAAALLAEPGRVADPGAPDEHFEFDSESAAAGLLREEGFEVRSVKVISDRDRVHTPDAVLRTQAGALVAADFKTPDSPSKTAFRKAVREGRGQARRVVVNTRPSGTPRAVVVESMRAALIDYGAELDELLVLGTDDGRDYVLRWTHSRR